MDHAARAWVDREQAVDLVVRGDRVWALVARPAEDGSRMRHQVVECTPGHAASEPTPPNQDCTNPVILADGTLLVLTDGGNLGGVRQVASRTLSGGWRTWTSAPGGVERFAAAGAALVVLEKHGADDRPWRAPVVAVSAGPARHWNRWHTEEEWRLVAIDRHTGDRRVLEQHADLRWSQCALALSPDGGTLACTPLRVAQDGILQRGLSLRILRGDPLNATYWGPPNADHTHPVFSPDGRQVAVVQHVRSANAHGRRQLCVVDVETGSFHPVAPDWSGWLTPCAWTATAGIVCRCIVGGRESVFAVQPHAEVPRQLDGNEWSWLAVAADDVVYGLASTLHNRPRILPVTAPGFPSITCSWSASTPCPVLYWPIAGPGRRPLVMMVHGGPVSAWTDSWHPRQPAAFFHSLGFHVLMPNPVGSTGQGDAHVNAIWHDWDACTRQLQALLRQALERPEVSEVVLFGGSFGGWAVNRLATAIDTPEVAGVITHAGIFDHAVMWADCDEPAAFVWHLGAGVEALHRADPARSVAHWTAPALILHGARDFNVPVGQAMALHHALERQGVPHRLVVFPEEGHHISSPRAIVRWWSEIASFLHTLVQDSSGEGG